jgi:uncharacterized membrane protein YeaQ/YmgE (transglycosylase-associated protein family)
MNYQGLVAQMVVYIVISAFIFGFLGGAIGRHKNMENKGFFLGLLLGPIGLFVIAVIKPSPETRDSQARQQGMVMCSHCREFVRPGATVCRHCQQQMVVPTV